ncbi:hypothetical protein BDB01DRAFT_804064 [Pilobolus umbonatus]|nr:hypothetical protein BDB01DRAFT_804064 [Pilobolus umbonatus]
MANVVLICYAIDSPASLDNAQGNVSNDRYTICIPSDIHLLMSRQARHCSTYVLVILVGCKKDTRDDSTHTKKHWNKISTNGII